MTAAEQMEIMEMETHVIPIERVVVCVVFGFDHRCINRSELSHQLNHGKTSNLRQFVSIPNNFISLQQRVHCNHTHDFFSVPRVLCY